MSQTTQQASGPFYIGIDFHKHYSVFCVIDDRSTILERGRIEHKIPIGFELLIKRYPGNWGSVFIFFHFDKNN